MSLSVQVVPILDSRAVDVRRFTDVKVYSGEIKDEILPPAPPPCFLGSWYRKVLSSQDYWLGIEGLIELGEFTPDSNRFNLDGKGRYMDNPSIYMGGNSARESDAGLSLNVMYPTADTSYELTLASPKLGYRPFWRYIYYEASDIDGNVLRREVNSWNISHPKNLLYYYFPGDILRMSVYPPLPDYLQLRIEVVRPTAIPKYQKLRQGYQLPNNQPAAFYSPCFYSKGHGSNKAEFKRVNAIDQYGNEGYYAQPTKAKVSPAVWHEVYLYREIAGEIRKVPFAANRYSSMICPNQTAITVTPYNPEFGGEIIKIHPEKIRKEN
ncbi:MAG: hypothetical protein PHV87_04140 [Bacilli bacterium]|nr:hypothetical protein [Bacilli bacterium]